MIRAESAVLGGVKVTKFMPVRVHAGGHFFLLASVFRVLSDFQVDRKGFDLIAAAAADTMQMACSMKYFGQSRGYFSGPKCIIMQVHWEHVGSAPVPMHVHSIYEHVVWCAVDSLAGLESKNGHHHHVHGLGRAGRKARVRAVIRRHPRGTRTKPSGTHNIGSGGK